ncbi:hypothetical protein BC629DRAFT_1219973 [Irpex lacteus]|nr:hypothetical protein BC629DRAFT_1219973 [Irpex lacteus]
MFPDDKPFADCLKFLEAIETTNLKELKFSCGTAWQDPPTVRKFFEVLSRQQHLTIFSLFVASIQTPWQVSATVYQQEYDLMHILNPMLSLKRLRVFHLQGSFRLDIDARHLGIIVSAWPCLQTLIILPHLPATESEVDAGLQASGYPRLPSFRALETIAKYAPQLKDLRIVMDNNDHLDTEYVDSLKEETFDSRLECLVVSVPAVWQQPDPDAVADFLHILFPGLTYAHFHDRRMVDGYRFDPNSSNQFDLPHTRWNASLMSRLATLATRDSAF